MPGRLMRNPCSLAGGSALPPTAPPRTAAMTAGGSIVNVASSAADQGVAGLADYVAAKPCSRRHPYQCGFSGDRSGHFCRLSESA
ncbi:hypothetical protein [Nocardia wallacei]|uniref:hypothetical protein n=1 Tax=Nocardia wallacei TaxID=480035 RepID=UPI0024540BA7|nr:hypothetical protein [Nocardia wallacei]